MRNYFIAFSIITVLTVFLSGCGDKDTKNAVNVRSYKAEATLMLMDIKKALECEDDARESIQMDIDYGLATMSRSADEFRACLFEVQTLQKEAAKYNHVDPKLFKAYTEALSSFGIFQQLTVSYFEADLDSEDAKKLINTRNDLKDEGIFDKNFSIVSSYANEK